MWKKEEYLKQKRKYCSQKSQAKQKKKTFTSFKYKNTRET